jgi:hypothetical protein
LPDAPAIDLGTGSAVQFFIQPFGDMLQVDAHVSQDIRDHTVRLFD